MSESLKIHASASELWVGVLAVMLGAFLLPLTFIPFHLLGWFCIALWASALAYFLYKALRLTIKHPLMLEVFRDRFLIRSNDKDDFTCIHFKDVTDISFESFFTKQGNSNIHNVYMAVTLENAALGVESTQLTRLKNHGLQANMAFDLSIYSIKWDKAVDIVYDAYNRWKQANPHLVTEAMREGELWHNAVTPEAIADYAPSSLPEFRKGKTGALIALFVIFIPGAIMCGISAVRILAKAGLPPIDLPFAELMTAWGWILVWIIGCLALSALSLTTITSLIKPYFHQKQ